MELPIVSVKKLEEDVIINHYKPGAALTEKDAQDIDNIHLTIAQGKDVFIIADFSAENSSYDRSAEIYFSSKGRMIPFTNAIAIIGNPHKGSFVSKLFGRKKTYYPVKDVKSVDEALLWFNQLRKELELFS